MSGPLVTIGVPAYGGEDRLPTLLECLRTQTHRNLDILISIDNGDQASADACRPFVDGDARFRLHVQSRRLGWAGNTDWTMRHRRGDFYIYQQHDDLVTPDYVASLVAAAERWPGASLCFARVELVGANETPTISAPSLLGDPAARVLKYLRRLDWVPLRGLIRGSALARTAGLLLADFRPFDSFGTEFRLLAELALCGEFRLVDGPTYFKSWHGGNLSDKRKSWWTRDYQIDAHACVAAWMLEVVTSAGESVEERRALFEVTLTRFAGQMSEAEWMAFASRRRDAGRLPTAAVVRAMQARLDRDERQSRSTAGLILAADMSAHERTAILRKIVERLRRDGRFDPAIVGLGWTGLDAAYFSGKT